MGLAGLRLADCGDEMQRCPRCLGQGRERCGERYTVRTGLGGLMTPGDRAWRPCSLCNGRRFLAGGVGRVVGVPGVVGVK